MFRGRKVLEYIPLNLSDSDNMKNDNIQSQVQFYDWIESTAVYTLITHTHLCNVL